MFTVDTRLLHYPPARYTRPARGRPRSGTAASRLLARMRQSLSASGSGCPMPRNTDLNGRIQATPKPT